MQALNVSMQGELTLFCPFITIFVCLIGTRCLYKRARDFARRLLATWWIT